MYISFVRSGCGFAGGTAATLLILLSQHNSSTNLGQYYEFSLGVETPGKNRGPAFSQVKFRYKEGGDEERKNITFPQRRPWLLPWQEFGSFVIRFTRVTRDPGHNLTFEQVGADMTGNKVLLHHRNSVKNARKIEYIAFAAEDKMESKIFFDCPNPRHANAQFIIKNSVPRLAHIDAPTCRPDLCDQCPRVYLPVCSSDFKTYRNECLFHCQRPINSTTKVLHKGLCMHWLWQN
ncbi:uncharacterized protein LOC134803369 isoform X2 [Cydia splendana]|uniref:uncharacterized protein LOC134803369 isoform X2 n=1 Tax=Cydia splendana TaxID=1100963 RepID=UPI0028F4923B